MRALVRATYTRWMPVVGREPKPMTADYAAAVRDHRIDLFEVDGALVALIEMVPAADHLLVENVAVATAVQGRGLGRELLAHAETVARSLGLGELRLYANRLMAGNIRLYGRLGYRVDREEERAPGWTIVHMRKTLAAPA